MTNPASPGTKHPVSGPAPASSSTAIKIPLDAQTRQLAALAYGESSVQNNSDEMMALASVLVRQRIARGYTDISSFTKNEPNFAYAADGKNARYNALMAADGDKIAKNSAMQAAIAAAHNALIGGPDKSNGAYFWDGADIKTNYAAHPKVVDGIKITDPSHNIYGIKDSRVDGVGHISIKIKNKKTGQTRIVRKETGHYSYRYDSTAGIGGTIFWKLDPDYIKATNAKEYK